MSADVGEFRRALNGSADPLESVCYLVEVLGPPISAWIALARFWTRVSSLPVTPGETSSLRVESVPHRARLLCLRGRGLDRCAVAVALEAKTGQELKETELSSIRTIQDVVDVLHRKLQPEQP